MSWLHFMQVGRVGAFLNGATVSTCSMNWQSSTGTYEVAYSPTIAGDHVMRVCARESEGLVGEYFGHHDMATVLVTRLDSQVNFNWAR